jgi:hypothetical protein
VKFILREQFWPYEPTIVADAGQQRWAFSVDYSPFLRPELAEPVLQTAEELRRFFRNQDKSVQDNGIWIVTTQPDAYSDGEKQLLENVKSLCTEQHIPLFIARASELADGWRSRPAAAGQPRRGTSTTDIRRWRDRARNQRTSPTRWLG